MRSKPLVSICCITYNHAPYIRDAIEGFLMQKTNFPFEIIIHDDASTDGTAEIVKEYTDKYPELIVPILQKENQYSKSVGTRISSTYVWPKARGKYIALCEGDDYWTDPLKLQKQFDFMEANPEYSITYHDVDIIDEKGNVIIESALPKRFRKDFSQEELIKAPWILTCTKFFRNVGEDSQGISGDGALNSLLGNYGKGKYLSTVGKSCYRRHRGGVWSSRSYERKRLTRTGKYLSLYRMYKERGDNKYMKYFKSKFNKTLYKFVIFVNFKLDSQLARECFHILDENYRLLTFRNKMLHQVLKPSQDEKIELKDRVKYGFVRLIFYVNINTFFLVKTWCWRKANYAIKFIKRLSR
jgi:glycosyltransferase involved in cell wall biosynthesis